MKRLSLFNFLILLAVLITLGPVGCKKGPKGLTPLGSGQTGTPGQPPPTGPMDPTRIPIDPGARIPTAPPGTDIPLADREGFDNMDKDRSVFQANTAYFAFDSSVVKVSEIAKVEAVAAYLRSNPLHKLEIEGHCDERGTEEYNRALGERRALALRESLAQMGINPSRVRTISFGEDKPAVVGHDESAWSKNRRGEFILLTPRL